MIVFAFHSEYVQPRSYRIQVFKCVMHILKVTKVRVVNRSLSGNVIGYESIQHLRYSNVVLIASPFFRAKI